MLKDRFALTGLQSEGRNLSLFLFKRNHVGISALFPKIDNGSQIVGDLEGFDISGIGIGMIDHMPPASFSFCFIISHQLDIAGNTAAVGKGHGNITSNHSNRPASVIYRSDIAGSYRFNKRLFFPEFRMPNGKTGLGFTIKIEAKGRFHTCRIAVLNKIVDTA